MGLVMELLIDKQTSDTDDRQQQPRSKQRVICGAKTRKGVPCRAKSEPGRRRCKFHGGKSTGPKTPEGRQRIAEAQRHRWAAWKVRNKKQAPILEDHPEGHKCATAEILSIVV